MTAARPLIAVVYDAGAVPAGEIGAGLADHADVVFLVPPDSAHVEQLRPVMRLLGEVRTLSGEQDRDDALVRSLAPDAVLTFSERMIRPAARLAAAAGRGGPSEHTARLFTDKGLQRLALREAGVDKTRTQVLDSLEQWEAALEAVGLPAIVKPVTGWSSRDTYAMPDAQAARQVHERLKGIFAQAPGARFILEEFLEGRTDDAPFGDYVSVESACTPKRINHFVLTGKTPVVPPFRGTGRIWPSHLPEAEQEEIHDLVTRALRAVGADRGFTHTEVKLTPDGPRIIEINGRISAHIAMMARESLGVDLVWAGARIALGLEPDLPAFDFGGKVHFQYNNLAPVAPARLEAVHGGSEVRSLPGITAYRGFARPGDELPGGPGTVCLDTISGVCEDHPAAAELIDRARRTLVFDLRLGQEAVRIRGIDLPGY